MPCFWCGESTTMAHGKGAVDHIVPVTAGGQTCRGNLVPACWRCNSSKNDRTPQEWMTVLSAAGLLPAHGALAALAHGATLTALLEASPWSPLKTP